MPSAPTFSEKKELARYIEPDERLSGHRPAITAFLRGEGENYLSVDSLEAQSLPDIVHVYQALFEEGEGFVAVCVHKVAQFTDAGRFAGVQIIWNRSVRRWEFAGPDGLDSAYKHRPIHRSSGIPNSPAHCGVEFLRVVDHNNEHKFARRMAKRAGYHVI